jgi:hypothetical protein
MKKAQTEFLPGFALLSLPQQADRKRHNKDFYIQSPCAIVALIITIKKKSVLCKRIEQFYPFFSFQFL